METEKSKFEDKHICNSTVKPKNKIITDIEIDEIKENIRNHK
jgi:hypothetical protein